MKRLLYLIGVAACLPQTGSALEPSRVQSVAGWNALCAEAAPQKRMVVLFFTASSGNCGDCETMKQKFYSSREFMAWVGQFAVLGEVDVSVGRTDFQQGRETYSMIGGDVGQLVKVARMPELPSIALYGNDGKFYDWALAEDDPADVAVAFHKVFQRQVVNVPLPDFSQPSDSAPGAPLIVPMLKLKMISGTAQRRLATINDETFFTGETHRVSLGNGKVAVQCLEIREKSVLVKVEGEAKQWELRLGETRRVQSAVGRSDSASSSSATSTTDSNRGPNSRGGFKPRSFFESLLVDGILGGTVLLYFCFCWSCRQLCRRAGEPSYFLVWLPLFKRIALFKAAGVSRWWFFVGLVLPGFGLWGWILCCIRLCSLFRQSRLLAFPMVFLVIGWPVFMYLAWSSRAEEDEPAVRALDRGRQYA